MLEQQELNQDNKIGRDRREANVSDQGQYAERDIIQFFNKIMSNNVSININSSDEFIIKMMTFLKQGIHSGSLNDQMSIELVKDFLNKEVDEEKREPLQKAIATSRFDSIAVRLKSYALLASCLEEKERIGWLAEFMSYGCYQQLVRFRGVNNLLGTRKKLAGCLRYCLKWLQYYFSHLKPVNIADNHKARLQLYPRYLFDEAFAVLEYYIQKDSRLTNSELSELQYCVKALYNKIGIEQLSIKK